jgi:hypothetical protein
VVAGGVSEHADGEASGALEGKDGGTKGLARKISNASLQTQTLAKFTVKNGWSLSGGGSIYGEKHEPTEEKKSKFKIKFKKTKFQAK